MERDDSMEKNKLKSLTAEVKDCTLDVEEKDLTKGYSAEGNGPLISMEEDENKNVVVRAEKENEDQPGCSGNERAKDDHVQKSKLDSSTAEGNAYHSLSEDGEIEKSAVVFAEKENVVPGILTNDDDKDDHVQKSLLDSLTAKPSEVDRDDFLKEDQMDSSVEVKTSTVNKQNCTTTDSKELHWENEERKNGNPDEVQGEEEDTEPVFDGTEVPGMEANRSTSSHSLDPDSDPQGSLADKAVAIKNFVREKSVVAVSNVMRRLSGKSDDIVQDNADSDGKDRYNGDVSREFLDTTSKESETKEIFQKQGEKTGWNLNPLSFIGIARDGDVENKVEQQGATIEESLLPIPMKGIILLYTSLGCKECREARMFLHRKKLRYVEINIDVYPSRKLELEKIAGSSSVPIVFFNEILVGGMSELKSLEESGKLDEKIEYVVTEAPPFEAPLPPLSGEDDMSTFGTMDELALIVRKMKETIIVKDRFYKMRRFTNCFLGSEAVNFLSEDQYLERIDAVEFGRKLASNLFFQHVLEENIFEDGNHLYRFLDHDPIVMSQCYNIPRGIIEVKPKPITEISSRLRFLSSAMFEAYTTEDGRHVDYRSIHGSEEFARYLRIIEELQRVDLECMPREEKLAFFINLSNMMVIHAILVLGYPSGALERRKMLGDFKYIIGGCTYSLSAIQNGILRGNQRPPYNLIKPFGLKDKRSKVALPYPEPLIHFALVFGNRSGPPLRCYLPGDIDKQLMEAARSFMRIGGLVVDLNTKVVSVSKILKWYSTDFGKNEVEVLKHAANYLEPVQCEAMLELLANNQLKITYQPYDWGLNN